MLKKSFFFVFFVLFFFFLLCLLTKSFYINVLISLPCILNHSHSCFRNRSVILGCSEDLEKSSSFARSHGPWDIKGFQIAA